MLPQDTDWFRNQISAPPHEWDSPTSTKEKLERRAEFDRWLAGVKAQAIVEDRAQLLDIAKGNLKGCSGYGCDECESVMFIDDIVVQRQIMSGEE